MNWNIADSTKGTCQLEPSDPWDNPFELLRSKWHEIPAGEQDRRSTHDLLSVSDQQLLDIWEEARESSRTGDAFSVRGWYHTLYKDVLRGKKVVDVGSGFGLDGLTFALHGARMTFMDIVETNLAVLKRLCGILKIENAQFVYLEDFSSFDQLDYDYDVIWCQGSLINAPFQVIRAEIQQLLKHLKIGGRWIELAYPETRWVREGRIPFTGWGAVTDGGAPWMEWYDLDKLKLALSPAQFEVVLYFDFHNADFNWFDLLRIN